MKRLWPFGVIALLLIAAHASGVTEVLTLEWFLERQERIMRRIEAGPLEAIVAYVAVYAVVVSLGMPGALILTLIGGYLFGWLQGGLAAMFGATLGALLVFLLARFVFADLVRRRFGGRLTRLADGFRDDAAGYLLFLRLVPLFPFAFVNLAAAILNAPFRTFAWTTLLGILPGTFTFAVTGSGLQKVIENEAAALQACRELGTGPCKATLDPASLVSSETLAALCMLGVLALTPMLARRFLGPRFASRSERQKKL